MTDTSISRRTFLCTSAKAALGLSVLSALPALPGSAFALPDADHTVRETRLLMGTFVSITVNSPSRDQAGEAIDAAFTVMNRLIDVFDRHTSSSALGVLNSQGRLDHAPEELLQVLGAACQVSAASEHAFNPAILPLLRLYEEAADISAVRATDKAHALALAAPQAIRLEGRSIRLNRQGMSLTLDGIAKGAIADAASHTLIRYGAVNHLVDAGGDIKANGVNSQGHPWRIGIELPGVKGRYAATLQLNGQGIATSAGHERPLGKGVHHLLDPKTGMSPAIAGVTVTAPTTCTADALATAASILPASQAVALVGLYSGAACLIVDRHGRKIASPGWKNA